MAKNNQDNQTGGDQASKATAEAVKPVGLRLVCSMIGSPKQVDAYRFATIAIDDVRYHVSEPIPDDAAARLLQIPEFGVSPLAEDVVAPLFEQALIAQAAAEQADGSAPSTTSSREAALRQDVLDLQSANQTLAAELKEANERAGRLEATNIQLAGQLSKAKQAGYVESAK